MTARLTRRDALTTATVSLAGTVLLAGCLGDDDEESGADIPDAAFEVVDFELVEREDGNRPQMTVQHSGDPITIEDTHSVEIRSEVGEDEFMRVDAWVPPTDGAIDGDQETFAGQENAFEPNRTIQFVWISPDAEREAELNTSTVPE